MNPGEKNAESENLFFETSRKIRAFVILDPRKAADDMDTLMSAIKDAELRLECTKGKDPAKEFEKLPAFVRAHLDWSVDEDGIMHVSRLQNSFSFDSNRVRMFVMFSGGNRLGRHDVIVRHQGLGGEGVRCLQNRYRRVPVEDRGPGPYPCKVLHQDACPDHEDPHPEHPQGP